MDAFFVRGSGSGNGLPGAGSDGWLAIKHAAGSPLPVAADMLFLKPVRNQPRLPLRYRQWEWTFADDCDIIHRREFAPSAVMTYLQEIGLFRSALPGCSTGFPAGCGSALPCSTTLFMRISPMKVARSAAGRVAGITVMLVKICWSPEGSRWLTWKLSMFFARIAMRLCRASFCSSTGRQRIRPAPRSTVWSSGRHRSVAGGSDWI